MKDCLKIALLQIRPGSTLEENLRIGIGACQEAKEKGTHIALFPEMWSNGYSIHERSENEWMGDAILQDSLFVNTFGKAAKELDMAVAISFLEKYPGGPRNTVALFDRYGDRRLLYSKVHTCDFDVERALTPGEDFAVCDLDTAWGVVKTGAMICYDREFPESARILMLKGAELVIVPNACPMEINRLSQLRARAYENMVAIATCNYPEGVPDCNGNSSVFDGVAYLPDEENSRDMCVLQAGMEEGVYIARLDLSMLREYREREVQGNAYRKPEKYGLLTSKEVRYPFIRPDRRS